MIPVMERLSILVHPYAFPLGSVGTRGARSPSMAKKRYYVVAYDIVDDKKRYRVSNTLKDFGERVQKSVFECRLDAGQCGVMSSKLSKLINPKEDSILIYPLCKSCAGLRTGLGLIGVREEKEFKVL